MAYVERLPQRQALADDVYEAINALLMDSVIAPDARITIDTLMSTGGWNKLPRDAREHLLFEACLLYTSDAADE